MRKMMLFAMLGLLAGCAAFPIEKHLVIDGKNIETPYGKGEAITITRDVCFGGKCDMMSFSNQTAGNTTK